MNNGYLTTREAAEYLRVSIQTVKRWANKGLVGGKAGRVWRFTKAELDSFVAGWQDRDLRKSRRGKNV